MDPGSALDASAVSANIAHRERASADQRGRERMRRGHIRWRCGKRRTLGNCERSHRRGSDCSLRSLPSRSCWARARSRSRRTKAPAVPPAVDPGTPTYAGPEQPVPPEPVAFDPTENVLQEIYRRRPRRRRRVVLDRSDPRAPGRRQRRQRALHQGPRALHVHAFAERARLRRAGDRSEPGRRRLRLPRADRGGGDEPLHGHRRGRDARRGHRAAQAVPEPLVERPHGRRAAGRPAQVHHPRQRRRHGAHAHQHRQRAGDAGRSPPPRRAPSRRPRRPTAPSGPARSTRATT